MEEGRVFWVWDLDAAAFDRAAPLSRAPPPVPRAGDRRSVRWRKERPLTRFPIRPTVVPPRSPAARSPPHKEKTNLKPRTPNQKSVSFFVNTHTHMSRSCCFRCGRLCVKARGGGAAVSFCLAERGTGVPRRPAERRRPDASTAALSLSLCYFVRRPSVRDTQSHTNPPSIEGKGATTTTRARAALPNTSLHPLSPLSRLPIARRATNRDPIDRPLSLRPVRRTSTPEPSASCHP